MTDDRVHARIETPGHRLGFRPPPSDIHLRAMDVRGVWVVYVWSAEGDREPVLAWLKDHGDFEERGPSSLDRVLAVETSRLPREWERLFGRFEVPSLVLRADGGCVMSLRGSRDEVQTFIEAIGDDVELEQMIEAPDADGMAEEDPLTETERDALLAAYKAGYFAVPRKIRLSELAEQMDRSTGSMSTLLRRATEHLVSGYARNVLEGSPENAVDEMGSAQTPSTKNPADTR